MIIVTLKWSGNPRKLFVSGVMTATLATLATLATPVTRPLSRECRDIVKVREQEIRREIKNQSQKEESLVKSQLKKICLNVHV